MAKPFSIGESLSFFWRWLRNPFLIGAVAPSSIGLSNAMAAPVDLSAPGKVIELGGGTGKITSALLKHGVPPSDLFVVEKDPALHRLLVERFPGVTVVNGAAERIRHHAEALGLDRVKAVVSGLPLIGMPFEIRREICDQTFEILAPDGVFVQFTYGPVSPVSKRIMARSDAVGVPTQKIWKNIPPATVWVYRCHGKSVAWSAAVEDPETPERAQAAT